MTTPRTAPGSPKRTCTRPAQTACDHADKGRETAADVLKEYFEDIGGRPEKPDKGTKRKGRASTAKSETGTPASTKRTKTKEEPAEKAWSPPPGSWEHDVSHIDTVEQNVDPKTGKDTRFAYLVWNNHKKTQHPLKHIYTKCPQKVSHLPFVPAANSLLTDASRCSNTTRATSCSPKTTPPPTATPWTKPTRTTPPPKERLILPAPTHHIRAARRTSSRHPTASYPSATQVCSIWEDEWNSRCCWQ